MIVKGPASDNVMRNGVQELRDQGVKAFRVFAVSEAKTLEGAGNQSLVDFSLAMGRDLTSSLKRDLLEAGDKRVSPAIEPMSLLAGGDDLIGKNDLIGRIEAGQAAEVELEASGHMLIAPALRA